MKALNIIGLVLSIGLIGISFYYLDVVSSARWNDFFNDDYNYSAINSITSKLTEEVGVISFIFFLFFTFLYIANLVKIKTTSSKVFAIIGLSFTFLIMVWDGVMYISSSRISFDEVGPAWVFYSLLCLAFCIVHLVQSVRYGRKQTKPKLDSIIDDGEFS